MDLDQLTLVRCIQLHRFIPLQRGNLVKIHIVGQMPITDVAQWTCAVSNLGFIYICARYVTADLRPYDGKVHV